ncbi:type I-E CRISPR-associated protein Cas6/Cse3/CasE [Heliobacterium undosum]|uniref:Type I-E CRISPR-associated protein Cas6/Cse3/CasE n=1 Tax=Heliomicrobium undosum TaxID=121734 RepID=A0A845L6S7_9FIRM|nr:type I-E CRISPR-associated protein Cas6/Cse3/CasE [Heliomicrobium undosum]MZP30370.1 type I-E CRISPR-associated protein Cas6/Cse3/CasE [Heliomicrobium undosum]
MYLSELKLDSFCPDNRRMLSDSYAVHRWLMRAFPDQEAGGAGRVLYRVETERETVKILVQSECKPDWSKCVGDGVFVRGPKSFVLIQQGLSVFREGQILRFRLRANPIVSREGKRFGRHKENEQIEWLVRKGEQHGFSLVPLSNGPDWFDPFGEDSGTPNYELRVVNRGIVNGKKLKSKISHLAVDFDGLLQVTDPQIFIEAIRLGIGPAKAFGFGLLSVAKVM